jgi:hypothetical protein
MANVQKGAEADFAGRAPAHADGQFAPSNAGAITFLRSAPAVLCACRAKGRPAVSASGSHHTGCRNSRNSCHPKRGPYSHPACGKPQPPARRLRPDAAHQNLLFDVSLFLASVSVSMPVENSSFRRSKIPQLPQGGGLQFQPVDARWNRLVKRRWAMLESNPPRNSWLQTHQDDGPGGEAEEDLVPGCSKDNTSD